MQCCKWQVEPDQNRPENEPTVLWSEARKKTDKEQVKLIKSQEMKVKRTKRKSPNKIFQKQKMKKKKRLSSEFRIVRACKCRYCRANDHKWCSALSLREALSWARTSSIGNQQNYYHYYTFLISLCMNVCVALCCTLCICKIECNE